MRSLALLGVAGLLCAACAGGDDNQVIPPTVVGMQDTVAPAYDDGQMQIYQVSSPVRLPIKKQDSAAAKIDPYPRGISVTPADTRITVRFTITNLDDKQHTVELLVDPWNEFVKYKPGFNVDDETTTPDLSGIDRFYVLPPKGRIEGILTPDDMVELANDLATAMMLKAHPPAEDSQFGGPLLYNRAFNIQNRSSQPDPVLAPYHPAVTDGLTGFDLGLRTYEKAKLAVEIVLEVDDLAGDKVLPDGDDKKDLIGQPGTLLQPPQLVMK